MSSSLLSEKYLARPGQAFDLSSRPTRVSLFDGKSEAKDFIKDQAKAISKLSHRLYGEASQSLLIILQGMDTSGKDGTTSALFHRTPPLNVNVKSFKAPTKTELAHDYLWRVHQACPGKGQITVFNRSQYEDVLVVKVREFAPAEKVEQRYEQINQFEKHLTENGTHILKFMLNISHGTQGERLRDRLVVPGKRWKFNPGDLEDRALWPDFMAAYQTMVERTSTEHAPWHVIPSDSRSNRNAIITDIVRKKLDDMNPNYPDPGYRPSDFNIA
ncbi:MAG: PPK2 family polyphosphate kinase [Alphaproteobacteria bacterium]